jgi:hypothetical protein
MRLTRNHPALTANDWFEHMLFADSLGHAGVRAPGDLSALIVQALGLRNFRMDNGEVADMKVVVDDTLKLDGHNVGSRDNPNRVTLKEGQEAGYNLAVNLKSAGAFFFKYPVKLEVNYNGGPLEGGVKWANEAQGPQVFTFHSEADTAKFRVAALPGCDFVNRPDGTCQDFVYMKVYNNGDKEPVAKKRFYVRVKTVQ